MTKLNTLKLNELLSNHLKYNHIPPVTTLMVEPCVDAILATLSEDYEMPVMVGDIEIPAYELMEDLHLDDFVNIVQTMD